MTTESVFLIAEAGSNWRVGTADGDRYMARTLVRTAAAAGANAVKFQTFRARDVYVPDAGPSEYLSGLGITRSINEIFEDLEMPYSLLGEIATFCADEGIEFMSTPFSVADAEAIDPHVRRHKVASYEINHVRLLERLAGMRKPLVISTGAATVEEIEFCLNVVSSVGAENITLLQCTSRYPAPPESLNLAAIPWMRERFGVATGFSDHSRDPHVGPISAVALGATVIEKHFTMDNKLPGPDHAYALEPAELAAMVRAVRSAEQARGEGIKAPSPDEFELRDFAVRSIQAVTDIEIDEPLVEGVNFDVLRPGRRSRGMPARFVDALAGRRARHAIAAGDGITAADVDPPFESV